MSHTVFIYRTFFLSLLLAFANSQNCYKTSWKLLTLDSGLWTTLAVPLPVYSQSYVVYIEVNNPTHDDQIGVVVHPSAKGSPPSYCLGSSNYQSSYALPYCVLIASASSQIMNMATPIQTPGWDSNPVIEVQCLDRCTPTSVCGNSCEVLLTIVVCHNTTIPSTSCSTAFTLGANTNNCALPNP